MRLQLVTGRPFTYTCADCARESVAGDGCHVYADLDGTPFCTYYCVRCTERRETDARERAKGRTS